ncbi:DNA-processing protein DprA [Actinoplanes utahensis]|uniref:DNA-processing protein DprA n=1 Tax=Actinoplanes utahensis TaxID=1869 RepID=UPI000A00561B|nr:DNA-processing protein DprA [Actinoplanes utahensis]GIF34832.1 DNA protecting protein DprA [Actinoplanes utahensis]
MSGEREPGGPEDRAARAALTWLAEPGNRTVWTLVEQDGAPATLDRLLSGDIPDNRLRSAVTARTSTGDPRRVAEIAMRRAERLDARLVVPADDEWPARVNDLATLELDTGGRVNTDTRPPLCFWVRGPWPLGETLERSIAIVGSRAATNYGDHVTTDMAYTVAREGWTVMSGGAFGIDAAAHRATIAAGGRTVAALACGVDRPYPVGNSAMFDRIIETGLLVSEWPIGAEPLRHRFLIRNRVIAAATVGTLVVEAAARSGATQTMSRVLALGRPAMVVPGPVTSAMSVGCHEILRGNPYARVVTRPSEVLEEVGRIGEYLADPPRGPQRRHDHLDEESALVLETLPANGSSTPERIAAKARLTLRTVLRRLALLEVAGLVVRTGNSISLAPESTRQSTSPTPQPARQSTSPTAEPTRQSTSPTAEPAGRSRVLGPETAGDEASPGQETLGINPDGD